MAHPGDNRTFQYMDSTAHDDEMAHVPVWQDSSAEHMYGDYVNPGGVAVMESVEHSSVRPSTIMDSTRPSTVMAKPDIKVGASEEMNAEKKHTGRKRVWPGWLMLILIVGGAIFGIFWFGQKLYNKTQQQQELTQKIADRTPAPVSAPKICEQPNFVGDGAGGIVAEYKSGLKKQIVITGINWSGMENVEGVPHGLAFGQSTMDAIAKKLVGQGVTAVRLPLNVKMINSNAAPNVKDFVDPIVNADFSVTTYMEMIKKVVQGLAKQQIAVLLDIHKLDPANLNTDDEEGLWYNAKYPEAQITKAITTLATELCNYNYYNIIGVDLKNEPHKGCWPSSPTDTTCPASNNWPDAAGRLANTMLTICPKWMAYVEGIYETKMKGTFPNTKGASNVTYGDWWGASLGNASSYPVPVTMKNKVVFAPHFYSPSVYPAMYYFSDNSNGVNTEFPMDVAGNTSLKDNVYLALDNSFGTSTKAAKVPVVFGEFGGIYGTSDKWPLKTSSRAIEAFVSYSQDRNMSGGFAWSLNSESLYNWNPANGTYLYGLYTDNTWADYHDDYAAALRKFKGSGPIYCVKIDATDGSGSSTSTTLVTPAPSTKANSTATH
ncbi:cell 5A endo-1,4-betaglucanase [Thraustotheca clavata]|uniref:Cell 5A endo-1,4-betaglucanase n=1 Tax=Thraustotheca clavata TaxID=74557 RepID=A0A1W0AA55_9STRA|nr:cell 5A endo-1,4-betaglucanase [Thraustotheca clavata]